MKILRLSMVFLFVFSLSVASFAFEGVVATEEGIKMLKEDLLSGKIQIGKTRLMDIRKTYGDAPNINITEKRITYDYGDLRLIIDKKRYWRSWDFDGFKDPAYTDDIDDLRFDLESEELVGDNITYAKILRDYDAPTEMHETNTDGGESIYFYGDIKLVFENYFVLQSWKGSIETQDGDDDVLIGSAKE